MTTHTFLDDDWLVRFNVDISATPRGVILEGGSRLRLRVSGGPAGTRAELDLDIEDGRPVVLTAHDREPADAGAEIPYELFRTMILEGNMREGMRAYEEGALVATGRRETLLYFLYHLYPGGPEGAAGVASRVSAYTA